MGQSALKADHKQLRRVIGPDAVRVINSHADTLSDVLRGLELYNERLTNLEAAALRQSAVGQTWWTRVRWVCLGR